MQRVPGAPARAWRARPRRAAGGAARAPGQPHLMSGACEFAVPVIRPGCGGRGAEAAGVWPRRRPAVPDQRRGRPAGQGVGLPDQGVRADAGGPHAQRVGRLLPPGAAHHRERQRGRQRARVARDHVPPGEHAELRPGTPVGARLRARLQLVRAPAAPRPLARPPARPPARPRPCAAGAAGPSWRSAWLPAELGRAPTSWQRRLRPALLSCSAEGSARTGSGRAAWARNVPGG